MFNWYSGGTDIAFPMLGSLVNRLINPLGYTLISSVRYAKLREFSNYLPLGDVLTEHIRRVLARHPVDCIFDVGANDGAFAKSMRKDVGFQGWIFSFEPIPKQIEHLRKEARGDDRWVICPFAMGATSGTRDFQVMSDDVFSSFLSPSATQPDMYMDSNCVASTFSVQVRTVAEVWEELRASHQLEQFYLKMDTQGFDLEVFAGAKPVLKSIPAFQSELAYQPIYEGAPHARTALEVFRAAGYDESMQYPISYDDDLVLIEADGIFIRGAGRAQ